MNELVMERTVVSKDHSCLTVDPIDRPLTQNQLLRYRSNSLNGLVLRSNITDILRKYSYIQLYKILEKANRENWKQSYLLININHATAVFESNNNIGSVRSYPKSLHLSITDV